MVCQKEMVIVAMHRIKTDEETVTSSNEEC